MLKCFMMDIPWYIKLAPISPAWSTLMIFSSILRLSWSSQLACWLGEEDESLTRLVRLIVLCGDEDSKMWAHLVLPRGIKAFKVIFWAARILPLISVTSFQKSADCRLFCKLSACPLRYPMHLVWHAWLDFKAHFTIAKYVRPFVIHKTNHSSHFCFTLLCFVVVVCLVLQLSLWN